MKSRTVLKLKVKEASHDLTEIGNACRRGWNAGAEDWLLRQRGKPESEKQSEPSTRKTKRFPNGEPRPKAEATKIYHAITTAVPELGTSQAAALSQALSSNLNAKLDWRRGDNGQEKQPKRRDAILCYEDRPPFRTSIEIPILNAQTTVIVGERLKFVTRFPLSSIPEMECELSLRDIPPGVQKMLREIADGTRPQSDSKLILRDDTWFWHLPVTFETNVSSDIVATLYPTVGSTKDGKQSDRPFRLELPEKQRPWWIGDGRYLLAQVQRLTGLRKQIGWRYRQRMGSGHGRKKIDAAVRARRKQQHNVYGEVRRRAIADIVRQCVRSNVGTLVYREPSLPLRDKCWFAAVGLEWDWTRFHTDLKNAAARQGIEVVKKQLKWKEAMGDAKGAA